MTYPSVVVCPECEAYVDETQEVQAVIELTPASQAPRFDRRQWRLLPCDHTVSAFTPYAWEDLS